MPFFATDIAKEITQWTPIAAIVSISVFFFLKKIGLIPDSKETEKIKKIERISNILSSESFRGLLELSSEVYDIKEDVSYIKKQHIPKGDKYKSDLVCECSVHGEKPCFSEIISKLDSNKESFLEFKELIKQKIETDTKLEEVFDRLLRKIGE